MPTDTVSLLDVASAPDYVRRRGLTQAGALVAAQLGGGVSNIVLAVVGSDIDVVVKQALPRLNVAEEWLANQERALTEACALRVSRACLGEAVPEVLDVDDEAFAITIERAPDGSADWKSLLLAEIIDVHVASELGRLLAVLHRRTASQRELANRFDQGSFRQLRLDPYYETSAARNPRLAPAIRELEAELVVGRCLVHGDFSPKNVLVGDRGLVIIDFEVAHWGNPVFDVAFLLSHLVLKSIHLPAHARELLECGEAFAAAYGAVEVETFRHVGALLVARVDGKSPAEYLAEPERRTAHRLGGDLLREDASSVAEVWARAAVE